MRFLLVVWLFCLQAAWASPSDIPTLDVEVPPPPTIGVLGIMVDDWDGTVMRVYPGSDCGGRLWRGEQILEINGKPYSRWTFQEDARGLPGTRVTLTIKGFARIRTAKFTRTDYRRYIKMDAYYMKLYNQEQRQWETQYGN